MSTASNNLLVILKCSLVAQQDFEPRTYNLQSRNPTSVAKQGGEGREGAEIDRSNYNKRRLISVRSLKCTLETAVQSQIRGTSSFASGRQKFNH